MLSLSLHLLLMVGPLPILMNEFGTYPIIDHSDDTSASDFREEYCRSLAESGQTIDAEDSPWFCMCMHCDSNKGPKGNIGDNGRPGIPGRPGPTGPQGLRGSVGLSGRPGIKGQKGMHGMEGGPGPVGEVGSTGTLGFTGEEGEEGFPGFPGYRGPKGEEAACPEVCENSVGPPGSPGLKGPAGDRGEAGDLGDKGPKGTWGDKGSVGPTGGHGAKGMMGEEGLEGDCDCVSGQDGPPGLMGDEGDQGYQGQDGPDGPTGPQGVDGVGGSLGGIGMPGPCTPTIQSAFSAGLTVSYPPDAQPVIFSHIFYNVQESYSDLSGIYTAPVGGIYVFSYHLSVVGRPLKVGLFLNYNSIVKNSEQPQSSTEIETTAHSVILELVAGDKVWIQVKDSEANGMYTSSENSNIFSGFLLHPDSCEKPDVANSVPDHNENNYNWGA